MNINLSPERRKQMVFVLFWWFYLRSWWNKPSLQTLFFLESFLRTSLGICPTLFKPSGLAVKSRGSRDGSLTEVVLVWLVLSSQELWGYDQILYQVTQQENIPKELCVPRHRKVFLCPWQLQMNKRLSFLLCLVKLKIKNSLSYHSCTGHKFPI